MPPTKPSATDSKTSSNPAAVPGAPPEGIDPDTGKPFGVDPDTGELVSATPKGLAAHFGLDAQAADDLYCRLAGVNGGATFFNPRNEPKAYRPPINIADVSGPAKEQIEKILAEPAKGS
jgi:hypothetical protein